MITDAKNKEISTAENKGSSDIEQEFFFPDYGRVIKAKTYDEALAKLPVKNTKPSDGKVETK